MLVAHKLSGFTHNEKRSNETEGLASDKNVYLEQRSKDTLENLKNTRQILNNYPVIIISNRYHLARCQVLAKSLAISHSL